MNHQCYRQLRNIGGSGPTVIDYNTFTCAADCLKYSASIQRHWLINKYFLVALGPIPYMFLCVTYIREIATKSAAADNFPHNQQLLKSPGNKSTNWESFWWLKTEPWWITGCCLRGCGCCSYYLSNMANRWREKHMPMLWQDHDGWLLIDEDMVVSINGEVQIVTIQT